MTCLFRDNSIGYIQHLKLLTVVHILVDIAEVFDSQQVIVYTYKVWIRLYVFSTTFIPAIPALSERG